ncbi:MAG: hypothetical protein JNL87_01345 [Burkholderiaceae bacterium]|nr:hypothetical protein [Burkholderiaceae bacterium]
MVEFINIGAGQASGSAAPHAALKDEDPGRPGSEVFKVQTQDGQANCAAPSGRDQEGVQFAKLSAIASRHRIVLHELAGGYLMSRWSRSRELPDLRAVALLLRQMGVCQ